ncbi:MAG: hypothetical protein AB7Q29_10070 [Vicinamibacterales bacterium]
MSGRGWPAVAYPAVAWLAAAALAHGLSGGHVTAARQESAGRLVIPFLANATKPSDLDFMGVDCDVTADGSEMTCRFRQVFLTTPAIDPASCVITTNSYDRVFRRDAARRWISRDAPVGACAVVETATLEGEGRRWTLTFHRVASVDRPECRGIAFQPETYDTNGLRRRLPCAFVQPGELER